jgi:hypothetical protein
VADSRRSLQVELGLDEAQLARIGAVFGVEGSALDAQLASLAAAALEEYALAFSGTRNPSTIREQRELRLCLLYEHLPAGEPTDEQVSLLFQMTPSQVSTLVAGTRARFEVELAARLRAAAIKALTEGAEPVDEDTIRIVVPDSLARYLRDLVAQTAAAPILKRPDASRTYDIGRNTLAALCARLGIDPTAVAILEWPS